MMETTVQASKDAVLGKRIYFISILSIMRKFLRKLKIIHDKKRLEKINYILYSKYIE